MKTIRFYVMEDSPDVLKEILEALEETPDCEAIGSSASIQDGYEQIIQLKPDALLLDISLIGGTAFEFDQGRAYDIYGYSGFRIIGVSGHDNDRRNTQVVVFH